MPSNEQVSPTVFAKVLKDKTISADAIKVSLKDVTYCDIKFKDYGVAVEEAMRNTVMFY